MQHTRPARALVLPCAEFQDAVIELAEMPWTCSLRNWGHDPLKG